MKRYGDLYSKIIDIENLKLADQKARKGKMFTYGVRKFDKQKDENIKLLHKILAERRFCTSEYKTFTIYEPKEREIHQLPYFPDRIVHHAIMNVLEPVWCSLFISGTYSCIKGRGIHGAMRAVKKALRDVNGTKYCLKIDVRKYYPSIDHGILKKVVRKKIKCNDTLNLLDEIIDSAPGVPIGNYLSQYFANVYLAYFDHYMKEVMRVKYYFRYADDIVILAGNKAYLHGLLVAINDYFQSELKLEIKSNYRIFPVCTGLDFAGFVFRHSHTMIRKRIKQNFARRLASINKKDITEKEYFQSVCGWLGWAKYTNSINFCKNNFKYESKLHRKTK